MSELSKTALDRHFAERERITKLAPQEYLTYPVAIWYVTETPQGCIVGYEEAEHLRRNPVCLNGHVEVFENAAALRDARVEVFKPSIHVYPDQY